MNCPVTRSNVTDGMHLTWRCLHCGECVDGYLRKPNKRVNTTWITRVIGRLWTIVQGKEIHSISGPSSAGPEVLLLMCKLPLASPCDIQER